LEFSGKVINFVSLAYVKGKKKEFFENRKHRKQQ